MVERQLTEGYEDKRKLSAQVSLAFEKATYSPIGSLAISGALLPYSFSKLMLRSFSPEATAAGEEMIAGIRPLVSESSTDFDPPYTVEEASARLAQLFKNVGAQGASGQSDFARLVVATGHGARQVNSPSPRRVQLTNPRQSPLDLPSISPINLPFISTAGQQPVPRRVQLRRVLRPRGRPQREGLRPMRQRPRGARGAARRP